MNNFLIYNISNAILFLIALFLMFSVKGIMIVGGIAAIISYKNVGILVRRNISLSSSILLVIAGFFIMVIILFLSVLPTIYDSSMHFINDVPHYCEMVSNFLSNSQKYLMGKLDIVEQGDIGLSAVGIDIDQVINNFRDFLFNALRGIANKMMGSISSIFDVLFICVFSPIVAYFFLCNYGKADSIIKNIFPKKYSPLLCKYFKIVFDVLHGYIKGQLLMGIILAFVFAIGLRLIGVPHGILIGVFAGLMNFIPYIAFLGSLIVSLISVAIQYSGDWNYILLVLGFFMIVNLVENYVLTPFLIGKRVHVSPGLSIISIVVGGSVFGLVGTMAAIPVVAVMSILLKDYYAHYKSIVDDSDCNYSESEVVNAVTDNNRGKI